MNKIETINHFLDNENLKGTRIFYGSCIEDHLDSKDIDCCIITNQTVDDQFYKRYKKFLIENKFVIDEEIKYEDKLILSEDKISKAIHNYLSQRESVDLTNRYYEAVDRLIINILTTKSKIYNDSGIYKKLSALAWEKVLQKFNSLGGETFSDFIKLFHVNSNYKKYWGYAPRVIPDLFNRFYQYSSPDIFIQLLKRNVVTHPQKIAVYSSKQNLTYNELDTMSDNIAKALLQFQSKYVIVNYSHSFELIPIVYGILKAGKIYIPVDNTSSTSEINSIRNKFKNSIYLADTKSDIPIIKILNSSHQILDYSTTKIAYIIHTSGTTGAPKGVCVSRQNLNYILNACQTIAPVHNEDCYLFSTRNTFDVSITEIFGFLFSGGSVFVYSVKSNSFYKKLPQIIEQYHITHIAISPSVLRILLRYGNQKTFDQIDQLKYLLVAGEEFKKDLLALANKSLKKVTIYNVYGPTETTVYATSFNIKNASSNSDRVPIGQPLPGVKTLIKNNELLISGAGVSLGYFNNSKQTKEKFKKIDNQIFYHTGDIVKKENNQIIYIGRKDNQIQLYGIRVELGDIRNSVSKIINDPSRDIEIIYYNQILTLFYTGNKIPNLRKKLEEKMVSYKVPSKYINVPSFPLTSSGKIDKKKLLATSNRQQNTLEKNIVKSQVFTIVKKSINSILNQPVQVTDNLLNLGLDSLNSIELILDLEKKLNINLDNLNINANPSIENIVSFIENNTSFNNKTIKENNSIKIKNIPVIPKVKYTFPAFFYAKIYRTLDFNSKLYGRIFLGKNKISYEEIYHKLSKIEVFKSILSKDLNTFKVLDTPINISQYKVENARTDLQTKLKAIVDSSIKQNGLLYKFVYLEDNNEAILYYCIDHSICDSGSLDALEKYLFNIYDESTNYSSYIDAVFQHNPTQLVLSKLNNFNQQDDIKVSNILSNLKNNINLFDLSYLNSKTKNIYSEILIFLKSHLLKKYNINAVKVNLIYNIRKFNNLDFSSSIGDLHSGITYLLEKNEDTAQKLDNLISQYKKEMFNPKAIGYKDFPKVNTTEKRIIDCFDNTVYVSIDYLGIVSPAEFNKIWHNISNTNKEVNKLNSNKLNITAYIVDNKLKLIMSKLF